MSKNILNCRHASILVFCRKRKYFCPYWAGHACDDYERGKPKRVYQELLIMGPEKKGDNSEQDNH